MFMFAAKPKILRTPTLLLSVLLSPVLLLLLPDLVSAQVIIPPGSGQLLTCYQQADPQPASTRAVFNGAAQAVTVDAPKDSRCNGPNETHSFKVPGTQFTLGNYTLVIQSVSAGGQITNGPEFQFVVDVTAGPATVQRVLSVPPED